MTEHDPRTVFIRTSLIRTADHNYILGRHAFLRGMTLDGFWMAAHAAEKYLKASLLLNGHDTRFFAHDLVALWKAHASMAAGFMPDRFVEPWKASRTSLDAWGDQTISQFVEYLARFGSPDNRYQLVGYLYDSIVLQKIDQLMFFIRRTCRPLAEEGQILQDGKAWWIWERLPLEECVSQEGHELQPFFAEANPFWVSILTAQPVATPYRKNVVFQPGSLQVAIAAARELDPDRAKPAVIDLLRWLLRHVRLSRANQGKIRRALRRLTAPGERGIEKRGCHDAEL